MGAPVAKRSPGEMDGTDDDRARPDIGDLIDLMAGPLNVRSLAMTGLLVLVVFYTLHFARSFLLPIVLAALLSFLLSPMVRGLRRLAIPDTVGAAVVLLALLGGLGYGAYCLVEPAADWMAHAPETLRRVEAKLRSIREPVAQVSKAAEQVQELADVAPDPRVQRIQVKAPSLSDALLTHTQGFAASAVVTLVLVYFLLASGDLFLRKLVRMLPTLGDKKTAVAIARQIEEHISGYLLSVTVINATLGLAVGVVTWLIGLPNPALWGAMVAVLNFVPYVGPLTSQIVLALVGIMTFDHLGRALLAPAVYFALDLLETTLVTPSLLGRRLALNPVMIFVAVIFWTWLWGIAGALLAVPILATVKIFCDEIGPLAALGEFLGPAE